MQNGKASPSDWKARIDVVMADKTQDNNTCADCQNDTTEWSVWNHGVFVCIKCAGIHRQMGVHISKVKSTQFDKWSFDALNHVRERGNVKMNKVLECRKPEFHIMPSQSDVEDIRRFYITQKYQNRAFTDDMKQDAAVWEMPQSVQVGSFLFANNKKKVYLQLLEGNLYFFKNNHDSYAFAKYSVTEIDCTINRSETTDEPCLVIFNASNRNEIYHSLRAPSNLNKNTKFLVEWIHAIRRSHLYYSFLEKSNESEQKELDKPMNQFDMKDLEKKDAIILETASKKGGGARSWRKRWWVLYNSHLYYFKEDFRNSKKAKGIGLPQGHISLIHADIIWDSKQSRTGKSNALLICTPQRTFYIQPQQKSKDAFFNAIHLRCKKLTNKNTFDFVSMTIVPN